MTESSPSRYIGFEWDAAKSDRNVRERGLPFDAAIPLFDAPLLEQADRRHDYGEARTVATGEVNGVALVCVYTIRGDRRRIVSLRVANRRERNAYRTAYPR